MSLSKKEQKQEAARQILAGEKTQSEVAREFGISRQAVSLWIKRYKETGEFVGTGERGRKVKGITDEQRNEVRDIIAQTLPSDHQLDVPDDRWCMYAANVLLKRECGRQFSVKYCIKLCEEAQVDHLSYEEEMIKRAHELQDPSRKPQPISPDSEDYRMMTEEELEYYEKKVEESKRELKAKGVRHPLLGNQKRGAAFTKPKKKKKKKNFGKKKKRK